MRSGQVAVVGRANAGKSTLINVLVGEKVAIVSPKPQTTRERILGVLTTDDYRLPAIKNYLVGGFRPVLYYDPDSDMRARWLAVAEKLGFGTLDFIEE